MFGISFSEIILIAVVALIVIGPEKLPKVARTLGALTGRMQRYVAEIKEEVNRDVRFQELQQLQQEIKETASKAQKNIQSTMQEAADEVTLEINDLKIEAINQKFPNQVLQKESLAKKPVVRKGAVKKRPKKLPIQE
jgi:sec-independent protein translocase protein TatB